MLNQQFTKELNKPIIKKLKTCKAYFKDNRWGADVAINK